jgi:hypothetical protein
MKKTAVFLLIFAASLGSKASRSPIIETTKTQTADNQAHSATVPIFLDHNRIIIEASVYLPGGKMKPIKVWVDNGTPDMAISKHLANELRLIIKYTGTGNDPSATPPKKILVGEMQLDMGKLRQVEVEKGSTVGSGIEADMNLPSSVLCNYDIVIDYPARLMTIAAQGEARFKGKAVHGYFNPKNHLIQIPARLGIDRFNLALDAGTPVTFIDNNLVSKFSRNHPSWPSMYGAVGITNLWGLDDEPDWHLMRVRQLFYGDISFPDVITVSFPAGRLDYFQKRAGIPTAGLMGAASLLNYRLGIDYRHSIVYFEHLTKPTNPEMSLVGITLRPEANGGYSILGVPLYKKQPAVAGIMKGDILLKVNDKDVNDLTMGMVWLLLHGTPGTIHKLTVGRGGKKFIVDAVTHCFLCN